MRSRIGWLPRRGALLACLALLMLASAVWGGQPALSPEELDVRTHEIALELRCVVCQNLSVADSPSDLAKEMRALVREQVAMGRSRQEVLDYFTSRYGEYVLLSPPKRGFNLLVWGLPFAGLLAGCYGVYRATRRWAGRAAGPAPPPDPVYLERVRRELAERQAGKRGGGK